MGTNQFDNTALGVCLAHLQILKHLQGKGFYLLIPPQSGTSQYQHRREQDFCRGSGMDNMFRTRVMFFTKAFARAPKNSP